MKTYFVYMLKCADGSYFSGITDNLDRRLEEHRQGEHPNCWTYSRRPLRLVFLTSSEDANWAINLEKQMRKWRRSKKRVFINQEFGQVPVH